MFHLLIIRSLRNSIRNTYRYEVSPLFFLAAGVVILATMRVVSLPFMKDVEQRKPEHTDSHLVDALRKQEQAHASRNEGQS